MNDKLLNLLGICRRAGRMKIGCDSVLESVQKNTANLIFTARDISENTKKKIMSAKGDTPLEVLKYSKDELSFALGKTCAVLCIEDAGFAKKMQELVLTQNIQGGEIE